MVGTNIAHYQITDKLGQGGMGEVYRATDTKLEREVAIKVLPESVAQDKERLARFDREAKALAALSHQNIAGIHGVEQEGNVHALIMELVEGEDLSQRLKRGPLPVEDALDVCKQISEALDAAHEKGIIHRDLKPANVKLSPDGKVKVLDFGLAKADGTASTFADSNDSISPTITDNFTMPGTLLGTAAYMSPEQARGKPVDKRSDIWSFGCVLYECLTGKRLFKGEDTTETLASIIKSEPDWAALPPDTPPTILLLLRKCLAKDSRRRLPDIAAARIDLDDAINDPSTSFIQFSGEVIQETAPKPFNQWFRAIALVLFGCIAMALFQFLSPPNSPDTPVPVRRISMHLGMEGHLPTNHGTAVRLSPDGLTLAFVALTEENGGASQLYLRRLDQLKAIPLLTATNVGQFCFSPDSQWIAFRDNKKNSLKKVPLSGGEAQTLCQAAITWGIDWGDNGWIVFGAESGGIMKVPSNGGNPERVTELGANEKFHRWPHVLPGGRAIIYSSHVAQAVWDRAKIKIKHFPDGIVKPLRLSGHHARYLPSGHMVFVKNKQLLGVPFDLNEMTTKGKAIPTVEGIESDMFGVVQFDISPQGSLVYLPNNNKPLEFELEWVDREGKSKPVLTLGPNQIQSGFRISPKGTRLAYSDKMDVWVHDLANSTPSRLTFNSSLDGWPAWSPGGENIVFSSFRNGIPNLYWKNSDGSGETHRLTKSKNVQFPLDWHPDSKTLVIFEDTSDVGKLRLLPLTGDPLTGWTAGESRDFQSTRSALINCRFSPDGRWLAFRSDISGQAQIYIRPFPGEGGMKQVSIDGKAKHPEWSQSTSELLYGSPVGADDQGEHQIFIVKYSVEGESFTAERPVPWKGGTYIDEYNIHPDGKRLLVKKLAEGEEKHRYDRVVLFENFSNYLQEKVPTSTF
jgi:serine/threonine protein kinase/Tol biopolymer transport system component